MTTVEEHVAALSHEKVRARADDALRARGVRRALTMLAPQLGLLPADTVPRAVSKAAKAELLQSLAPFERHIGDHTFLVGERLSIADVSLACALRAGRQVRCRPRSLLLPRDSHSPLPAPAPSLRPAP